MLHNIVFLGKKQSGKTSLAHSLREEVFSEDYHSTEPPFTLEIPLANRVDTVVFGEGLASFSPEDTLSLGILCLSLDTEINLLDVQNMVRAFHLRSPGTPLYIVGTKADMANDAVRAIFQASFATDPAFSASFDVSAKDNIEIDSLRKAYQQHVSNIIMAKTATCLFEETIKLIEDNPDFHAKAKQLQTDVIAAQLPEKNQKEIAKALLTLVNKLQDPTCPINEKAHAITDFETNCYKELEGSSSAMEQLGKTIAVIAATAAVLLCAVAAGFSVGLLMGLWSGPAAVIPAIMGGALAAQCVLGGTVVAGILGAGLTAGLMSYSLFKTPAVDALALVVDQAHKDYPLVV